VPDGASEPLGLQNRCDGSVTRGHVHLSQRTQTASELAHNQPTVGSIPTAARFLTRAQSIGRPYARLLIGAVPAQLRVPTFFRTSRAIMTRGPRSRATPAVCKHAGLAEQQRHLPCKQVQAGAAPAAGFLFKPHDTSLLSPADSHDLFLISYGALPFPTKAAYCRTPALRPDPRRYHACYVRRRAIVLMKQQASHLGEARAEAPWPVGDHFPSNKSRSLGAADSAARFEREGRRCKSCREHFRGSAYWQASRDAC
jgi:hypothetical protein